ncbi:MAG: hypothetical protein Q9161_007218 [Pseudevernia consocians]
MAGWNASSAVVKQIIWLVNARPPLKALVATESASTVVKKATSERSAQIIVSSKELAASVEKKATPLPSHQTSECKANRVFDTSQVADMSAEDAWEALKKADKERDLDDFREAFKVYTKAAPDATYDELEIAFRFCSFNTYLIATENELPKTYTYVNLQGELDKTYKVGFHLSPKPRRETAKQGWPETPKENIQRLKNAGLPMERGIPKCMRCNELGHTTRACPEEAVENTDKVQVKCVNCEEVGHRVRDCPMPRVDKFACRNCNKVKCSNCDQMGHTKSRCKEPIKEVDDGGYGAGGGMRGFDGPAGGEGFEAPAAGGGDAWAAGPGGATDGWGTVPVATTVGGGGVQDDW